MIYHDWLLKQKCQFCGAKYIDKAPEKLWFTETWCGCEKTSEYVEPRDKWIEEGGERIW